MKYQAQPEPGSKRLALLLIFMLLIGAGSTSFNILLAQSDGPFYIEIDPATEKARFNQYGEAEPAFEGANLRSHEESYKTETFETQLAAKNQVEYMVNIEKGEVLLYSWEADGTLHHDFHAHPADENSIFWSRYTQGNGNKHQGSIVAPYSGEHGWLWSNSGDKAVTIKLTISGYYLNAYKVE